MGFHCPRRSPNQVDIPDPSRAEQGGREEKGIIQIYRTFKMTIHVNRTLYNVIAHTHCKCANRS